MMLVMVIDVFAISNSARLNFSYACLRMSVYVFPSVQAVTFELLKPKTPF